MLAVPKTHWRRVAPAWVYCGFRTDKGPPRRFVSLCGRRTLVLLRDGAMFQPSKPRNIPPPIQRCGRCDVAYTTEREAAQAKRKTANAPA
jgi:hypothetical protein